MSNGGPVARAITALADIETRLRRSLGLAGEVGTEFHPNATAASVTVDDATRPGCNQQRNRAFAGYGGCLAVGGNTVAMYWQAQADIWLERIAFGCQTPQTGGAADNGFVVQLYIAGNGEATIPPIGVGVTAMPDLRYIERASSVEVVPMICRSAQNAAVVPGFVAVDGFTVTPGQRKDMLPERIFLRVGDAIAIGATVDAGVAGNLGIASLAGRIF